MKVHEILAESSITENTLIKRGAKYAFDLLAKKYSDDLVKAYKLGIEPKALTPEYAEKFFVRLGIPEAAAKKLAQDNKLMDRAIKDAEKIMKATSKKLGLIALSATGEKVYNIYRGIFAAGQAWQVLGVPTKQFVERLDAEHTKYQNKEITLEQYQAHRQALASTFVGQVAGGIAGWAAIRGITGPIIKGMVSAGGPITKTVGLALRGATDATLLYLETNYLNTPEGRKFFAWVMADSIAGQFLQQSVGAAAVNAGVWLAEMINKAKEQLNKLPGVNFNTTPPVATPTAQPKPAAEPVITPRTSFEKWGKPVPADQ